VNGGKRVKKRVKPSHLIREGRKKAKKKSLVAGGKKGFDVGLSSAGLVNPEGGRKTRVKTKKKDGQELEELRGGKNSRSTEV